MEWDTSTVEFQEEYGAQYHIPSASFEYQIGNGIVRDVEVDTLLFADRSPAVTFDLVDITGFGFQADASLFAADPSRGLDSTSWDDVVEFLTTNVFETVDDAHFVNFNIEDANGPSFFMVTVNVDRVTIIPEPSASAAIFLPAVLTLAFLRHRHH